MKELLYINSNVNRANSRTHYLSNQIIHHKNNENHYNVTEVILENEPIHALVTKTLNQRIQLLKQNKLDDELFKYANQFKKADCIVIGAPYWDLGFPALLKTYIETINVASILYKFDNSGRPVGLCNARKLYYVTTRGGNITDEADFGYQTLRSLAKLYGIKEVNCISSSGLDIPTTNVKQTLNDSIDDFIRNH